MFFFFQIILSLANIKKASDLDVFIYFEKKEKNLK